MGISPSAQKRILPPNDMGNALVTIANTFSRKPCSTWKSARCHDL